MFKKLLAAGVAAGLGALALPALPALAAAASTATLTDATAKTVFPGARNFTISVANTEGGLLGTGKAINAVRITLPTAEAGITSAPQAPTGVNTGGFTGSTSTVGGTNYLVYRGGSIPSGGSATFTFPTTVLRPQSSDLSGSFVVAVSADGFTSSRTATLPANGTLKVAVKVLELVSGSLKPVAPTNADNSKGVTDRSGTAGQTVSYAYSVKNYAQQPLLVTPALVTATLPGFSDTPVPADPVTVPTGEVVTPLAVDLRLGDAATGTQRSTTVTAKATSARAAAEPLVDSFSVQGPVTFAGTNLDPVRTKSGEFSARDFKLDLIKTGVQGVSLATSTLKFGANEAAATGTPLVYGNGNGATKKVTYSFPSVTGPEGGNAVTVANAGTDDNLASYAATLSVGTITIDIQAPKLQLETFLPVDGDGDQQVASSNRDVVRVKGSIIHQGDVDLATLNVALVPDAGAGKPVTVTSTNTSATQITFEGTVDVGVWDKDATRFQAFASVKDTATNVGSVSTGHLPVDTKAAELQDNGVVLTTTTIRVTFSGTPITSGIRGGCDASSYAIDGVPGSVTAVRDGSGGVCVAKELDYNGERVLVLRDALSPTDTPQVAYTVPNRVLNTLPAKDGAGNDALSAVINTVNNVVPLPPLLVRVERKDGAAFETAYRDASEDKYYTNATGADDNRVTVSGVRNNYVLQVRDAAGRVLKSSGPLTNPTSGLLASDTFDATISVPTGTAEGAYARTLHLVSSSGISSDGTPLTVVVDVTAPGLAGTSVTGPGQATTTFNEKIVGGSDVAENFYVGHEVVTENGTAIQYKLVDTVSTANQTSRSLTFTLDDYATYRSMEYNVQSGSRYEDRAGNLLGNTI